MNLQIWKVFLLRVGVSKALKFLQHRAYLGSHPLFYHTGFPPVCADCCSNTIRPNGVAVSPLSCTYMELARQPVKTAG